MRQPSRLFFSLLATSLFLGGCFPERPPEEALTAPPPPPREVADERLAADAPSAPEEDLVAITDGQGIDAWNMSQGRNMAEIICSACHAIGFDDKSPHLDAPPLRDLTKTMNLDDLAARFDKGMIVNHPDMPEFYFEPGEVDALMVYIRSLQPLDD